MHMFVVIYTKGNSPEKNITYKPQQNQITLHEHIHKEKHLTSVDRSEMPSMSKKSAPGICATCLKNTMEVLNVN